MLGPSRFLGDRRPARAREIEVTRHRWHPRLTCFSEIEQSTQCKLILFVLGENKFILSGLRDMEQVIRSDCLVTVFKGAVARSEATSERSILQRFK